MCWLQEIQQNKQTNKRTNKNKSKQANLNEMNKQTEMSCLSFPTCAGFRIRVWFFCGWMRNQFTHTAHSFCGVSNLVVYRGSHAHTCTQMSFSDFVLTTTVDVAFTLHCVSSRFQAEWNHVGFVVIVVVPWTPSPPRLHCPLETPYLPRPLHRLHMNRM